MNDTEQTTICPACGSTSTAPIVYGLPDHELWAAEEAGDVVLGGCVILDDQPRWACKVCGVRWASKSGAPRSVR